MPALHSVLNDGLYLSHSSTWQQRPQDRRLTFSNHLGGLVRDEDNGIGDQEGAALLVQKNNLHVRPNSSSCAACMTNVRGAEVRWDADVLRVLHSAGACGRGRSCRYVCQDLECLVVRMCADRADSCRLLHACAGVIRMHEASARERNCSYCCHTQGASVRGPSGLECAGPLPWLGRQRADCSALVSMLRDMACCTGQAVFTYCRDKDFVLQLVTPWQLLVIAFNHSSGKDAKGLGGKRQWPAPLPVSSAGILHQTPLWKTPMRGAQMHRCSRHCSEPWLLPQGRNRARWTCDAITVIREGCISRIANKMSTATVRPLMPHNDSQPVYSRPD